MKSNINLCEILKGHEGETFYSPAYGDVKLLRIVPDSHVVTSAVNYSNISFHKSGQLLFTEGECVLFPSKTQHDWTVWVKEYKPRPKFKFNDKVIITKDCNNKGKICTITEIEWVESIKTYGYRFKSNEVLGTWYEDSLELYNIPKIWTELIPDKINGQYFKCEIRYLHDGSYKNYHYVDDCGFGTPLEKSALALLKSQMLIDKGYGGIVTDISYHTAGITSDLEVLIEEEFDEDFHVLYPFIFKNTQLAHEFLSRPENIQLIKDFYQKS